MGDSNLSGLAAPSCTVLAHANGRLSHFKALISDIREPCPTVRKAVVCLSSLDRDNNPLSNTSALKSLLGAAHRVFPQATLAVQLAGMDVNYSTVQKENLQALNAFVVNKAPSSCHHIPAPTTFSITGHLWSQDTKSAAHKILKDFLR